jgi:hypothetical protein
VGLKDSILGPLFGGGASTTVLTGGGALATSAFKSLVLKGLVSAFIALTATAGTIALVHALDPQGASNALADAQPGSSAGAPDALRAGAAPLWRGLPRHNAPALAHRRREGHVTGSHRTPWVGAVLAVDAVRGHQVPAVRPQRKPSAAAPAVSNPPPHPATAPVLGAGGGAGSESPGSGGPGNGHGHAYGHDPGHDPGLHLGWGQGDGGGRSHPHGQG